MGIENPVHLLFLAAVALIVLGPKRLPELARAAGKGMREFRAALNGQEEAEGPSGGAGVTHTATPTQTALPALPPAIDEGRQPIVEQTRPPADDG